MKNEMNELRNRLRDAAKKVLSNNSTNQEVKIKIYDNKTDELLTMKEIEVILQELESEFFKEDNN